VVTGLAKYNQVASSSSDLTDLVNEHATMVKRIGQHLLARLPNTILLEDLVQAGMMGLLEAARNYDASKGASFETYAGIRIRGMMLDEVRKGDWIPRSVHRNARKISDVIRKVENGLGRDATDSEVAKQLDVTVNEYHQMLLDMTGSRLFGLEEILANNDTLATSESLASSIPDPYEGVRMQHERELLAKVITTLPEREKLVLALYYAEELNLKEIGDVLSVSESRISQIHCQAMLRVQARIKELQ
jgi:RNA polymerase sigma factor for flagellar operon FliA